MKGRLFWKTFLGFWLTYLAISQIAWLPFTFLHYQPYDDELVSRVGSAALEICKLSIVRDGPAACQAQLNYLQPADRLRVHILPIANGAKPVCDEPPSLSVQAAGPDGAKYNVCYHYAPPPPWPRYIFHTPPEVLVGGFLGGFVFSVIFAWYLIAPIQRLRQGFEGLAQGRFQTRISQGAGRRRDEVADLAKDFDGMAVRLEALVSARDRLLHDISHEFRSPLYRLQVAVGLLRQDQKRLPTALERIERESERLNDLVDEILTLARMESKAFEDEYFDLNGLLGRVVSDAEFEAAAAGVAIECAMPDPSCTAPSVRGSSELIRRASENIIRNAIKFSSVGERISVQLTLDSERQSYVLQIADQGPGVAEGALEHLFEPFVKAGNKRDGFGLGLSIARRAVEAHGGRITAENRLEGGLLVRLVLPHEPRHLETDPAEPGASLQAAVGEPVSV